MFCGLGVFEPFRGFKDYCSVTSLLSSIEDHVHKINFRILLKQIIVHLLT